MECDAMRSTEYFSALICFRLVDHLCFFYSLPPLSFPFLSFLHYVTLFFLLIATRNYYGVKEA